MKQVANLDAGMDRVRAWWRYGYVWLILAGPVVVVVASLVTVYLAYHGADPVGRESGSSERLEVAPVSSEASDSFLPSVQARNHAATGYSRFSTAGTSE